MNTGILYLVATPIGNLEDISARAIRILSEVDLIAAEDTRHTKKLLNHFEIHTPLISYHAHNEAGRVEELITRLQGGESIALVTDAGTPCISDPGHYLVAAARSASISTQVVPGPCAAVAAYSLSGLDAARFVFHGFMPRKQGEVLAALASAKAYPAAHIYYESPKRLAKVLGWIASADGDAQVVVARELTKVHEELVGGSAREVAEKMAEGVRGECVLILNTQAVDPAEIDDDAIRGAVSDMMEAEGLSQRDAMRRVSETLDVPRNRVYRVVVEKS